MTQKPDAPAPTISTSAWYIVQQANGQCEILPHADIMSSHPQPASNPPQWGPYDSKQSAIAKRIGLIRAGKCRPM